MYHSFVKLVEPESDYYADAIDRFRSFCESRKLIANIDHKEGSLLHLRLIDPANPESAEDRLTCINSDLVAEGWASIDRRSCKYLQFYPNVYQKLQESVRKAKQDRAGMFEFGDVEEDDQ